jgi:carbonic anhydrase/acetyltransferase-like protein (isoleucine patch superfamily)
VRGSAFVPETLKSELRSAVAAAIEQPGMKLVVNRSAAGSGLRGRGLHRLDRVRDPRGGSRSKHGAGGPYTFALDAVAPRLSHLSYVADSACLVGDVELGEYCSVWFCAVIRADNGPVRIGCGSNVQDGAVIHCLPDGEVTVGSQVSIGHLATVHGACIGDRCLVGMNAVVMDGARIAHDTLVAAGSIVAGGRRFEPGVLLQGSPARVVRALTDRELAGIQANALQYTARADRFRRELRRL